MSRARSQVPLPRPMDPLQTTRMNDGVLYAAEWPCCHDPLRLSPSRPICCRPASITHRWRRQPPPLGRASATRSPLWLSVRSAHTARARPIARASHLRLNPAHRAHNTTQHSTRHTRPEHARPRPDRDRARPSTTELPYTRYAFIACACRFRERVQLRDVVGTPRSRRRR